MTADHEAVFAERKRRARVLDALSVTLDGAKPYEPGDFVDVVGRFMRPDEDTYDARRRLRVRVAELTEAISSDMSFEDAKELTDLQRMMRHQGADWKKAMHKYRAERGEAIPSAEFGNEDALNARQASKHKARAEREEAREARLAALEASQNLVERQTAAPTLDTLTDQALEDRSDLFSNTEPVDPEKEALRDLVADLQRQLAERDAEPPPLSPDPVKHMIPDEIRKLMEDGESLSNAKRRLTELLWVEQAELRNLRGTDRGDLKREAEIERLLGLFARLGEI